MKIKSIYALVLSVLVSSIQLIAFGDTYEIPLTENPEITYPEKPGTGHRIPSRPVNCSIDFDAKTVYTAPIVEDIESYEIWNEARTILLGSYTDDSDFVEALSATTEPVAIVLTTATTRYVGYYNY